MGVIPGMRWNPLLNALAASTYICIVVLFLHFMESVRSNTPDTLLDGLGVISLFVFSASVMAFLFFYRPLLLLIDGKKREALTYFLTTLGAFGAITATVLVLMSLQ